ncbi:MAG: hypothetical protein ACYC7J_10045 [Syntrophales bacterium]
MTTEQKESRRGKIIRNIVAILAAMLFLVLIVSAVMRKFGA